MIWRAFGTFRSICTNEQPSPNCTTLILLREQLEILKKQWGQAIMVACIMAVNHRTWLVSMLWLSGIQANNYATIRDHSCDLIFLYILQLKPKLLSSILRKAKTLKAWKWFFSVKIKNSSHRNLKVFRKHERKIGYVSSQAVCGNGWCSMYWSYGWWVVFLHGASANPCTS